MNSKNDSWFIRVNTFHSSIFNQCSILHHSSLENISLLPRKIYKTTQCYLFIKNTLFITFSPLPVLLCWTFSPQYSHCLYRLSAQIQIEPLLPIGFLFAPSKIIDNNKAKICSFSIFGYLKLDAGWHIRNADRNDPDNKSDDMLKLFACI